MRIVKTDEQQLAGRIATLKERQSRRIELCDQIRAQMDGTVARHQLEIDGLEARLKFQPVPLSALEDLSASM